MISKITLLLLSISLQAQILTGRVVDKSTQKPLEMVSVYFDNTTIGTSTDANGEFSIRYNDAVQSTLVISYLGYEKVYVSDYRQMENIDIALVVANNELDEVYLTYDDILTREQKLNLFRDYFLGTTPQGKACEILNEDDIYLRYNSKDKVLYANAKAPIRIYNEALGYEVDYDLNGFEITFRYVNAQTNEFNFSSAHFLGTMFFNDLHAEAPKRKIIKRRKKAFEGSIQHFMRALYNGDLKKAKYTVFRRGFKVNPWDHITIKPAEGSNNKQVELSGRISVVFKRNRQSDIYLSEDTPFFTVDATGHYEPILGVYFVGEMNEQRVGNMLPLNYGLN